MRGAYIIVTRNYDGSKYRLFVTDLKDVHQVINEQDIWTSDWVVDSDQESSYQGELDMNHLSSIKQRLPVRLFMATMDHLSDAWLNHSFIDVRNSTEPIGVLLQEELRDQAGLKTISIPIISTPNLPQNFYEKSS
jgi:hypothetical protein